MRTGIAIGSELLKVVALDHFVLTVASIGRTVEFYQTVLGISHEVFGGGRRALTFGNQKINLHESGREFTPRAKVPKPGSGDFCLLVDNLNDAITALNRHGIEIIEGPVEKTGAAGRLLSVYIRDPDENLVELSEVQRRPGP